MNDIHCSKIAIDLQNSYAFSPYIFGHNLEHTRGAVMGGLSAQMLRNRKFCGSATRNEGCPLGWNSIGGEHTFYDLFAPQALSPHLTYTRHAEPIPGRHRTYEIQSLIIQNLEAGNPSGLCQKELSIVAGSRYAFRIVARCNVPVTVTVALTNRSGKTIYAQETVSLTLDDWQTAECLLTANDTDDDACLQFSFTEYAKVVVGAVSLLPEDTFLGMRRDVIEHMKQLGITMLRWPGGNFAGDYLWKDGLLPVDQRAPLKAYAASTLPYNQGFDDHEIGIDEFIALCRELGAEPSITINPVWNSPQDNAEWVEYCNGSAETKYGALRVQRGHAEPYNVKYWGLGNELGHAHMEGPSTPEKYAQLVRQHAEAMLAVCPDLLLCSTGPYPSKAWTEDSANALADIVKFVSVHNYCNLYHYEWDYSTPEAVEKTTREIFINGVDVFRKNVKDMREGLNPDVHIAFDEWGTWRSWFRAQSTADGVFAGRTLHMLMRESVPADMPVGCFFEPVGEGAIVVRPESCSMTPMGQMIALLSAHRGGRICPVECAEGLDVMATLHDDTVMITVINTDITAAQNCCTALSGEVVCAQALIADGMMPHSRFREDALPVSQLPDGFAFALPPCSAAKLCIRIG